MTRMVQVSAFRRDSTAREAPTADAIIAALQRAGATQRGAWVGAVPLIGRAVSPAEAHQDNPYETSFVWVYEWPAEVASSAASALVASVVRELGAGWSTPRADEDLAQANVAFYRALNRYTTNPDAFPMAQDDPMRGVASVLSDPTTQGVLAVGGVGLGLWLLSEWLGD